MHLIGVLPIVFITMNDVLEQPGLHELLDFAGTSRRSKPRGLVAQQSQQLVTHHSLTATSTY
jgi:hypothetical protein